MTPSIPNRILIPTDFSECAQRALDYGAELVRRLGATIHLLYVSEIPKEMVGDWVALRDKLVDADIMEGRRRIEGLLAELTSQGVAGCTGEVLPGNVPAATILERANSGRHDTVVIGTHGRSGFKRLWVGSVAERVVRFSDIPVITVRSPHADAEA
jgi:nucleotide-binding universal stress UspA family protein